VIYPNPFVSDLELFLPQTSSPVLLRVFNLLGQELHAREYIVEDQVLRVNFPDLPSGIYLLSISGEGLNYTTKVVKR
jgi:hypothetical protein